VGKTLAPNALRDNFFSKPIAMKILVVHRQKELTNMVKRVLQDHEPYVRYAESGLDGLLIARLEEFDMIICGTDLPVITGFELIRSLRNSSINRNTTVIFMADEVNATALYLSAALKASLTSFTTESIERLGLYVNINVTPTSLN
jgi:CheY-like chemotaxis protein